MADTIREMLERQEEGYLHPRAAFSSMSRGRVRPEEPCELRPGYQRDRDRILHSKAFRRLKHKTQVFLSPEGDHYRTRLTHTLEVAQIARTIARALCLNEVLTEAIALAHDIGHTPFGHAGEDVLNREIEGGFIHYEQSLRVVDVLENEGRGLNLTLEVRDGIVKHSKGRGEILNSDEKAMTLESDVVRVADLIAYVNHDIDDARRAGIPLEGRAGADLEPVIRMGHSERIRMLVRDVVRHTSGRDLSSIAMSTDMIETCWALRDFLFEVVYSYERSRKEFEKAERMLVELISYFRAHPMEMPNRNTDPLDRRIADFIAGMTDRFAIALFSSLFLPRSWPTP